jgi:hypothetical protein
VIGAYLGDVDPEFEEPASRRTDDTGTQTDAGGPGEDSTASGEVAR